MSTECDRCGLPSFLCDCHIEDTEAKRMKRQQRLVDLGSPAPPDVGPLADEYAWMTGKDDA